MGLPRVCAQWLRHMTEVGLEAAKELLTSTLRSAHAALAAATAALSTQVVADYADFVVTQFDTDKVRSQILEKDWSSFATEWQDINVSHSLLVNLSSTETGDWKTVNGFEAQALDRAISKQKGWIIVVSLCCFIVEELPQTRMADRKAAIEGFQQQLEPPHPDTPANLVRYLEQERKKCQ